MKGALERVLNQCDTYLTSRIANDRDNSLNTLPLTSAQIEKYLEQATAMGSSGLRGTLLLSLCWHHFLQMKIIFNGVSARNNSLFIAESRRKSRVFNH